MKQTTTLEMPGSSNLFISVLLFLILFTIVILVSFVLRIFTLGLYRFSLSKRILKKYVNCVNVISQSLKR
jgi:hypothetical protein